MGNAESCKGENLLTPMCKDFCNKTPGACTQNVNGFCRGNQLLSHECKDYCSKNQGTCLSNILEYCNGNNLLKPECVDLCNKNKGLCINNLKDYCKDKIGRPEYEKVCACFYPPQFYDDVSKKIMDKWDIVSLSEENKMSPHCLYGPCGRSVYQSNEPMCGEITIAKCFPDAMNPSESCNLIVSQKNPVSQPSEPPQQIPSQSDSGSRSILDQNLETIIEDYWTIFLILGLVVLCLIILSSSLSLMKKK